MNVNIEDIAEGSRQYDDKVYKNIETMCSLGIHKTHWES